MRSLMQHDLFQKARVKPFFSSWRSDINAVVAGGARTRQFAGQTRDLNPI